MSPAALRKAAVLVASLDAEAAERVLDLLGPDQARLVRDALVRLDDLDADEQRDVIAEFFGHDPAVVQQPGDDGVTLAVSPAALDAALQSAPTAPQEPPPSEQSPFEFLSEAPPREVTPLVAHEHPQTIALVVSHLPPDRAAAILTQLPADVQAEVIARLVELDEAHPEIVREVERGLETRLTAQAQRVKRRSAGLAAVARILEAVDPLVADHIVANLQHFDPALADELAPPCFDFGDVMRLDDARLAMLLSAADPDLIVLSLAGASPAFSRRVLGMMPPRDARDLSRQLEALAPTRLSDIEAAQQGLADLLGHLRAAGRMPADVVPRSLAA